jgi:YVTN family beta-propeller protein
VLDFLDDRHVIRGETRYGGKWFELTHDRLIKPLIDSNKRWKSNLQVTLRKEKKSQTYQILFSVIIVAAAMGAVIGMAIYLSNLSEFHIIDEIPLGSETELSAIATNPITNMAYAAGYDTSNSIGKVFGINGGTGDAHITGNISIPFSPFAIAVDPTTNMVYAVGYDGSNNTGTVSVINGTAFKLVENIKIGEGFRKSAIAVNPDTNLVYIADFDNDRLAIIDGDTNRAIRKATEGELPGLGSVSVDPSRNLIYLYNSIDDQVYGLNGSTHKPVSRIAMPFRPVENIDIIYPYTIAINPTTNMIYAAGLDNLIDTFSVFAISGNTHELATNIETRAKPIAIAINPATNIVYVTNGDDTTSLINGTTNKVILEGIKTGGSDLSALAINPVTNRAYFLFDHKITVMDPNKALDPLKLKVPKSYTDTLSLHVPRKVVNFSTISSFMYNLTIPKKLNFNPDNPESVAVSPVTKLVYVANYDDNSVSVINGSTNKLISTIGVGLSPLVLTIDLASDVIYVLGNPENRAYFIDIKTNTVNEIKANAVHGFVTAKGTYLQSADAPAREIKLIQSSTRSLRF